MKLEVYMEKSFEVAKKIIFLFCFVFTLATLVSCAINLSWGYETDTYSHILDRAFLSFMGASVFVLILNISWKRSVFKFLIPYMIFMPLALLYIFVTGFFRELHPNAYRDIFLNDTIAYIIIYIILYIAEKLKMKLSNK